MIILRKMKPVEFPDYVASFIPEYAAEIRSNYDVSMDVARARAERAVAVDLAQGVDTVGQILLCAVAAGDDRDAPVGFLWCTPNDADRAMFISDFFILPSHRGKGYGRSALRALEAMAAETGYHGLRLRVAADNAKAEGLYLSAGFRVTGTNMQKAVAKA